MFNNIAEEHEIGVQEHPSVDYLLRLHLVHSSAYDDLLASEFSRKQHKIVFPIQYEINYLLGCL